MLPQRLSFGSGSPMIGGPMVASQMQSGVPGMGQQGPQSPGFAPQMQQNPLPGQLPSPSQGMPGQPAQPGQPTMMPQPMPQAQPKPLPKSEHELIIQALAKHLENSDHIEKMRHEMLQHDMGLKK